MIRHLALALAALACASPAGAADAPEAILSPGTQLYIRWDGVAPHNDAYKKSVWGGVMAGPTGDSIRVLLAKGPKLLGSSVLADPLLDGQSPAELKANLADLKAAGRLVGLIAEKGVLVAAEVREPLPTLKGVGQAVGGLLGGGKLPGADAIIPDAQLLVIVPDAGEEAEVLFGSLRLLMRTGSAKVAPLDAGGRKGFTLALPDEGPVSARVAWWVEGKHFVFYAGTRKPAAVIAEMKANAAKGGLTTHPLYRRCAKLGDFESVARGFADAGRVIGLVKALAGPLVPGLRERLDSTGIADLKAVVFSSGFAGKESRALYEFDTPGPRRGIAKVLKREPLKLDDLPPMPPDVSRFSALRLDPAAAYDAGIGLVEFLTMSQDSGVEEKAGKEDRAALIQARKDYLAREADKFLGISVRDDLLPYLGDKFVTFQSPTEGLQVFGTVFCVSVKDAAKVRDALARMQVGVEAIAGNPVKVRRKLLKGVEIREFYSRGFLAVTPAYAVVGDWLIIAGNPQCVQGVVLRAAGELEKWKPDEATAERLAKMQPGCGLQYCTPKSTVGNVCCVGPLFLNLVGLATSRAGTETDFDPIDVGLIPNGHELSKHLFPNLTVTRDDGTTVRVEVNESFSLPLEVIGAEPLAFAALLGLGL